MIQTSREEYGEKLRLYDKLVATNPKVERKGSTVPYKSLNGHMFSYLSKSGELALGLPAGTGETFLKKYKTTLCAQYGIIQKEYVMVPDRLLQKTQELKTYFDLSYAYVGTAQTETHEEKGEGLARRAAANRCPAGTFR
jgi:hypothetical protein